MSALLPGKIHGFRVAAFLNEGERKLKKRSPKTKMKSGKLKKWSSGKMTNWKSGEMEKRGTGKVRNWNTGNVESGELE